MKNINSPIKNQILDKTAMEAASLEDNPNPISPNVKNPSLTPSPPGAIMTTIPITDETGKSNPDDNCMSTSFIAEYKKK